jgi:hypothetical protein
MTKRHESSVSWIEKGHQYSGFVPRPYATDNATPKIPFWLMVFKNIRVLYLGSDDFQT